MSHQIPPAHPIAHANAANQQQPFLYGYPQGLVPLAYPPGLPPPPFAHPYPNSHSQFMQPPPPMPNSYGQYPTFGFPVVPSALDPVQTSALRSKDRPNRQIHPGVFAFQVDVLDGEQRETFQTDTEVSWGEFRGRVVRSLGDPEKVQLSGKIVGNGRWGVLNGDEGLEEVLRWICQKATNARTKPVALEVKNMVTRPASKKGKAMGKRTRKDDIPPVLESDDNVASQYNAYKQLEEATRCEGHKGHCFISRKGGSDNHHRLSHQEMTLWAKKMSLNEATKYAPPNCLNFDSGPALKSGRQSASTSSVPEVHVTIQNIGPDSVALTPPIGPVSSTSTVSLSSSSAIPQHPPASLSDFAFPPVSYQPSIAQSISIPQTSNSEAPESRVEWPAISWGTPIPALQGQNVFPPLSSVIALLDSERPGKYWNQLDIFLREAGIYSSEHILLADATVLALVGNMGTRQATILRNYAKRVVLPVLELKYTYQEEEDKNQDMATVAQTGKRQLDLGESIVHSLYKKQKTEPIVDPAPNLPAEDWEAFIAFDNVDDELSEAVDDGSDVNEDVNEDEVDELDDSNHP